MRALLESNIYFISPTNSPRRQFNDHDNSPGDAILIFSAMQFAEKCVLEEITGVTNAWSSHDRSPRVHRVTSRDVSEKPPPMLTMPSCLCVTALSFKSFKAHMLTYEGIRLVAAIHNMPLLTLQRRNNYEALF